MKKTSLIGHLLEVLELIEPRSRPADVVLAEFFRNRHYLGSKDRRFIAETLYSILRNYLLVESYVAAARNSTGHPVASTSGTPVEVYVAFARVVLKEEHGTILTDVVSFWPSAGHSVTPERYLDAIEQTVLPPEWADQVQRLAFSHSMPVTIVREWVNRYGEEEAEQLCAASNLSAPITIRANTLRCTVSECQALLEMEHIKTTRTRYSPVGLMLEKRVNIQGLRAFREGAFEIQDEGSQLLSFLLDPAPGSHVVDACAGAGGKTLHIAAIMGNSGSILAIDTEWHRLDVLRERAVRAGITTVHLRQAGDTLIDQWNGRADAVLVDAPCTGVGTFRRNPGAKMAFEEQSVPAAAERQLSILKNYSRLVKPGGRLVYATCSLLMEENEDVTKRFLEDHQEFHIVPALEILTRKGITLPSPSPFLTLLPHKTGTDGFFGAVLERQEAH